MHRSFYLLKRTYRNGHLSLCVCAHTHILKMHVGSDLLERRHRSLQKAAALILPNMCHMQTILRTSRKWQPTPVFLPEESHRQRSLAGYSPQGHRESDTTEATTQQQGPVKPDFVLPASTSATLKSSVCFAVTVFSNGH